MAFQIVVNLFIAVIWLLLAGNYTFGSFIFGYLIGVLILFLLRRFLEFEFYLKRVWAIIKLIVLFFVELIKANIDVLKIVIVLGLTIINRES